MKNFLDYNFQPLPDILSYFTISVPKQTGLLQNSVLGRALFTYERLKSNVNYETSCVTSRKRNWYDTKFTRFMDYNIYKVLHYLLRNSTFLEKFNYMMIYYQTFLQQSNPVYSTNETSNFRTLHSLIMSETVTGNNNQHLHCTQTVQLLIPVLQTPPSLERLTAVLFL